MGCIQSDPVQQQSPTGSGGGGGGGGRQAGNAAMLARCVADWDREYPAVTRAQLMAQRAEFWDTRVEGRPEMWQALRAAAEVGDEGTARVLMDSAGLTPYDCDAPYSLFCYDPRGARYDVPMYCLHEPRSLIKSERVPDGAPATGVPPPATATPAPAAATNTVVTASGITISSAAPIPATQPIAIVAGQPLAAGAGAPVLMPGQLSTTPTGVAAGDHKSAEPAPVPVAAVAASTPAPAAVVSVPAVAVAPAAAASAPAAGEIDFKVRLSTGEADIAVSLAPGSTIGDLKARIASLRPAIPVDKQRVIFSGALLQNSVTIQVAKIKPKAIVQIMVTL